MKGIDFKTNGSLKKEDDWISYYQQPHWKKPERRGWNRHNLYRVVAALLIFAAFLALNETNSPWGLEARETLKSVLTTEWDYQPAMEKVVQFGLQVANSDRPFFRTVQPVVSTQQQNSAGVVAAVPVSGKVARGYGMTIDPVDGMERFHSGIDIAAPVGSAVRAVWDGRVKRIGDSAALGKYILLEHDVDSFTLYGGLARLLVDEGQQVQAGQTIGETGAESDVSGGGLHLEVRENSKLVDPLTRLQPLN